MKKIKVLGPGCAKCNKLTENAEQACREAGVEFEIEKISELKQMMKYGVMMTPALVIDGVVKCVGRVLSPEDIKKHLK